MKSINKYLVIYDVILRQKRMFSIIRKNKFKYEAQRIDDFQTFADSKNLYTFIENIRARNLKAGYARVLIKRVFTIESEMAQGELNDFYNEQATTWKESYAGLASTIASGVPAPASMCHSSEEFLEKEILEKEPLFLEEPVASFHGAC